MKPYGMRHKDNKFRKTSRKSQGDTIKMATCTCAAIKDKLRGYKKAARQEGIKCTETI